MDKTYEVRESMPHNQALIIVSKYDRRVQYALYCNDIFHRRESIDSCIKYWKEYCWIPASRLDAVGQELINSREVLLVGTLEECVKYARTARMLD